MTAGAPREGWRRVLHLATGSLGLAALYAPHAVITALVLGLLALALLVELARRASPTVQRIFITLLGAALRPAEHARLNGGTALAAGYTATWLLFHAVVAAPAMIVAAVADPAAAAVGTAVSRSRGRKTLAGTAAAWAAAFAVLLLCGIAFAPAAAGALAAALAERVPGAGLDNIAVPLATALALQVLA